MDETLFDMYWISLDSEIALSYSKANLSAIALPSVADSP
jgi:hypothetical protein